MDRIQNPPAGVMQCNEDTLTCNCYEFLMHATCPVPQKVKMQ